MPPPSTDQRIGVKRPMRSESLPTTGLAIASSPAVKSQSVPIATAEKPRSSSRSGARTAREPKNMPGSTTNQIPTWTRRLRIAVKSRPMGCGRSRGGAG